jgi:transcriptional regulator with XRE-family HTH domain
MVCSLTMTSYAEVLSAYLAPPERTQAGLAEALHTSQPAVHRWASGSRFPDKKTALRIEAATGGAVPFTAWQAEAARKIGLDVIARPTPTQEAKAAA